MAQETQQERRLKTESDEESSMHQMMAKPAKRHHVMKIHCTPVSTNSKRLKAQPAMNRSLSSTLMEIVNVQRASSDHVTCG
jgi:hypothetical protein